MMRIRISMLAAIVATVASGAAATAQDRPVLIKGARVFTGTGEFQEGVEILLQDGKIAAVGSGLSAPADADVLELDGRFVTPGLVDANTSLGLPNDHENEQSSEITPHVRVVDAIDPESTDFTRAVENGVTTAYISPGGFNVFGGLGCVYKTAGPERLVRTESGLRMTLGSMPGNGNMSFRYGTPSSMYYRRPTNRMGVIWEIRKAFYDAMDARETRLGPTAQPSPATRVLIDALDRKVDVRTTATADQDIRTAIRLADEFGIKIVLDGAVEAYYALDYIVAAKVPVIAHPPSVTRNQDGAEAHLDTVALLAEAGVPVAIQTGQGNGALPLIREAAFAVRGGMKRAHALAAVTSVPATILGVADRVGSLEKGKDADVVVWSRHPLSPSSRTERVWVGGQSVQ